MRSVLKKTYRNFIWNPVTNYINLFGLSISLSLVIMLSIYCYSELTTDNFQVKGDHVYLYGQGFSGIYTPAILKELIDLNIPGVESTVRIAGTWQPPTFKVENNVPIVSDLIFVDDEFFNLFTYKAVAGDLNTALKNPMSVVITKSLSEKLFGKELPIGKTMKLNDNHDLTITAVIEESHANSCLTFSAICSINTRKIVQPNGAEFTEWGSFNFQTFLLLEKNSSPDEIVKRILALFPKELQTLNAEAGLIPLKKLYFSKITPFFGNYLKFGDRRKVIVLLMVASLVLLTALVNFINISTVQWFEKIKYFGIMKIFGATQFNILRNILSEAFLLFLMALVIAILLINNKYIQNYTGIHFSPQLIYSPGFIFISIACTFILSVLFSLIPAWKISTSKPLGNLKKSIVSHSSQLSFRGILVMAQFSIAIVLIAFTILVQKQIRFGSIKLGVNQGTIIGIKLSSQLDQSKDFLKKVLMEKPMVKEVSFTQFYPNRRISHLETKLILDGGTKDIIVDLLDADATFFSIMKLELIKGRFYDDDMSTDKAKIVVNETFLRDNTIADPIGGKLVVGMDGSSSEIIGVVKDFHFKSVSQPITPLAIINKSGTAYCLVKVQTTGFNSLQTVFQEIKTVVSELSPTNPMDVTFFNQAVANMYKSELQFRRTFTLYAGCAVVICCLGIFAMSLVACQHRIKEIGIRKVNGAEAIEILAMLNKNFIKWVAIAFIMATPVAWYFMHRWLQNFAYKTDLSWWVFALAGVIAFGIALLTITIQSWRTANRNPVEALRYE